MKYAPIPLLMLFVWAFGSNPANSAEPGTQQDTKLDTQVKVTDIKKDEKPPHVVERPDKKAGVDTFAHGPTKVVGEPTEDCLLAESKLFMSRMPSGHGDVRF